MRVSVRLFATLRERAGCNSLDLDLPDGASVNEAVEVLRSKPEIGEVLSRLPVAVAVNREYATAGTVLRAGDELALVPPVSGGAGEVHVHVGPEQISLQALSELVVDPGAGAIISFQGITREVDRLDYEAYCEMAREQIASILGQCVVTHGLAAAAAAHRVGPVPLGEASVVIVVSAAHRAEAFAGAREAIDRIKAEAPIWKREIDGDLARWVEGTPAPGAIPGKRADG